MPADPMEAADVIRLLDLARHPEGGWFRETFRDAGSPGTRPCSTAIHYLLGAGDRSHWHRILIQRLDSFGL